VIKSYYNYLIDVIMWHIADYYSRKEQDRIRSDIAKRSYSSIEEWAKEVINDNRVDAISFPMIIKKYPGPEKKIDSRLVQKIMLASYFPLEILDTIMAANIKIIGKLINVIRGSRRAIDRIKIAKFLSLISQGTCEEICSHIYPGGGFLVDKKYQQIIPTMDPTLTVVNAFIMEHKEGASLRLEGSVLMVDDVVYRLWDNEWLLDFTNVH
jgi:hypothetical protein